MLCLQNEVKLFATSHIIEVFAIEVICIFYAILMRTKKFETHTYNSTVQLCWVIIILKDSDGIWCDAFQLLHPFT